MARKPYLPRDERGWRVPKSGTLRRRVYDLMVEGKGISEIADAVDRSYNYVGVTAFVIRNADTHNVSRAARPRHGA
jgi:hypothetical protein